MVVRDCSGSYTTGSVAGPGKTFSTRTYYTLKEASFIPCGRLICRGADIICGWGVLNTSMQGLLALGRIGLLNKMLPKSDHCAGLSSLGMA